MTHLDIINLLGGYRWVAEALGKKPNTVMQWTIRSIPPLHWPAIARLPSAVKFGVTVDTLERSRGGASA